MAMIVAGQFTTFGQADESARHLYERGFSSDDVSIFFLNPGGQHAQFPIGGDVYADSAARPGGKGALVGTLGGAAVGLAAGYGLYSFGWRYGFVVVLAAALIGAYIGAFGGALGRMRGRQAEGTGALAKSENGVILAAHVTQTTASTAEAVLQASGAVSIERVEGDWQNGEWRDFDPCRLPGKGPQPSA